MLEKTKGQGGITLVALVVTIVVLLILAGITIALVFAQNGVVGKAQEAAADSNKGTIADNIQGYIVSRQMDAIQTGTAPGNVTEDMTTKLQAAGITVTASSNTISIAADTTVTISGDITFELNGQRIIFGWVPSRANETDSAHLTYDENSDNEQFIWAGTFVAHEIYQREDGTLGCRVPQTVWDAFKEKTVLADETLKRESGRVTKQVVSNAGDCYRFETTVTAKDGLRSFSVGLRDNEETGVSYCFTVLCAQNRVIFEKVPNWPWPQMNNIGLERPVHPNEDGTYHIQIIADDTIATLYINGVALNARMYTQPGDGIVLAAEDGTAAFKDMSFAKFPLK